MLSFTTPFLVMCGFAFGAYFLGIVIRKLTLPGTNALPLDKQLLLGIPASLVVESPLLAVLSAVAADGTTNQIAQLGTLGIIMEHGMLVNETLSRHLKEILDKRS